MLTVKVTPSALRGLEGLRTEIKRTSPASRVIGPSYMASPIIVPLSFTVRT